MLDGKERQGPYLLGQISPAVHLFCKIGIHRYEKIDINYSFGPGGSTETIKCKDCGIKKIRKKV